MTTPDDRYLLYCLTPHRSGDLPHWDDLEGPRGLSIRRFGFDAPQLGIIASPLETSGLLTSPTGDDLESYAHVIERIFRDEPVFPLQFGQTVESRQDLSALLESHGAHVRSRLHAIEGCVEVSVRLPLPESSLPDTSRRATRDNVASGGAYLEARRRQRERLDPRTILEDHVVASRILEIFDGLSMETQLDLARDSQWFEGPTAGLYGLLPRDELDTFWRRIDALEESTEAELEVTGPWPPYNFTEF